MKQTLFSIIVNLFKDTDTGCSLSGEQWEEVVFVLRQTQLLATLYHLASAHGHFQRYPDYARKHMHSASVYAERQAQQVRYECLEIAAILNDKGIVPVFLKGAGYTLAGSQNGMGRIYSDIDVLVEKSMIDIAQNALQKKGWHSKQLSDYDKRYYREWAHEVPPMFNIFRSTIIDLHHNIVPPITGRAPEPKLFFNETFYNPEGLALLSPPAATLHSCVHLFTNEDFTNGFRDLVDLYLLIQEYGDEEYWKKLLEIAEMSGFTLELFYCIEMLKQIFDMELPESSNQVLSNKHENFKTNFLIQSVFKRALNPHHPLTFSLENNLANFFIYIRGHWIKMPFYILVMHLSVKSFFLMRDLLFGKYQFDKGN